jgi:hypothetical protein
MTSYQLSSKRAPKCWDGPLRVKMELNKATLIKCFVDATPVGKHEHDQIGGSYKQPKRAKSGKAAGRAKSTEFPRVGGRLRRLVGGSQGKWNVFYNKDGSFARASISFFSAYALIVDQGGPVAARNMAEASRYQSKAGGTVMHFNAGGGDKFAKYRRGFTLQPQSFVEKGFNAFCDLTGAQGGVNIGWINASK